MIFLISVIPQEAAEVSKQSETMEIYFPSFQKASLTRRTDANMRASTFLTKTNKCQIQGQLQEFRTPDKNALLKKQEL